MVSWYTSNGRLSHVGLIILGAKAEYIINVTNVSCAVDYLEAIDVETARSEFLYPATSICGEIC